MFVPAVAKKVLKALAISVLSVVGVPLVRISVTLWVFFLRLAASLSISQDFFEFLLAASACSKYCALCFLMAVLYSFLCFV